MKWQCQTCTKVFEKPLPRNGHPLKFCSKDCRQGRPITLRARRAKLRGRGIMGV